MSDKMYELVKIHAHYGHSGSGETCTSFDPQELEMFLNDIELEIEKRIKREKMQKQAALIREGLLEAELLPYRQFKKAIRGDDGTS